jgi:hypothetical protein
MEATAWGLPKSRRATRGCRRAGWGHPAEIASARARSDRAGRRRRADGGVGCVGQGKVRQGRATAACGRWCRMRRPGRGNRAGRRRRADGELGCIGGVQCAAACAGVVGSVAAFDGEVEKSCVAVILLLFFCSGFAVIVGCGTWASNTCFKVNLSRWFP